MEYRPIRLRGSVVVGEIQIKREVKEGKEVCLCDVMGNGKGM